MKAKSIHGQSVAVNVRLSAETYTALRLIMTELEINKTQAIERAIIRLAFGRPQEQPNELHG